MRRLRASARILFLGATALVLAAFLPAQDPSRAAPDRFTEKLDNDRVQVFEDHSKPGEKEPMHSHRANVVYVIQGGKVRFTLPDGRTQEREFKAGEVIWREATTHAVENIGTTEIRSLIVELKGPDDLKKPAKKM